jgi:3D (Asp-Asp-Asp) domain-containing protein
MLESAPTNGNGTYLGTYTLTAYCATGSPCADGAYPQCNYTIACNDPSLWHRWIYIEGYGTYFVHDTGGMPSGGIIDVFVGSYDEAISFGVRSANCYLVN